MLEAIHSASTQLKAALEVVDGLCAPKTKRQAETAASGIRRHLIEAQRHLMDATLQDAAATSRIAELEHQILKIELWGAEKDRFKLVAVDIGAYAYVHRPGMELDEPPLWLCQPCFDQRHKSFLHFLAQDVGGHGKGGKRDRVRWGCSRCRAQISVHHAVLPSATVAIHE